MGDFPQRSSFSEPRQSAQVQTEKSTLAEKLKRRTDKRGPIHAGGNDTAQDVCLASSASDLSGTPRSSGDRGRGKGQVDQALSRSLGRVTHSHGRESQVEAGRHLLAGCREKGSPCSPEILEVVV